MSSTDHVTDLLPAYINGTLPKADEWTVAEHLRSCSGCRADLASWRGVGEAARAFSARMPEPDGTVLGRAWEEIDGAESPARRGELASRLSLLWQVLAGQVPLVRREIWAASALTMLVGVAVALLAREPSAAGVVLSILAPAVAAAGVALVYGPENDPSLEVALSTPTPPRVVLLSRLTLVYGYDLALALAATAILTLAKGGVGLWPLISLWLGPMLFLSAFTLLISLFAGTRTAMAAATALWATKVASTGGFGRALGEAPVDLLEAFWHSNGPLLALAAALLALALLYVPRMERTP